MNLRQIYAATTPAEREELTLLILQRIQSRQRLGERRLLPTDLHWIADRRAPSTGGAWWPFEPPTRRRTPHVIACSLLGMTAVLAVSLASATTHPSGLLMIPAYGIFLLIILGRRQNVLNLTT